MNTEIKHAIKERNVKKVIRCFKSICPIGISVNLTFLKNYGRFIRYKKPELMDEKLLILYSRKYVKDKRITKCVDKYEVRKYIEEKGLSHILIDIIGVYSNTKEIVKEKLPDKFVMKCNHGSGYNIVVRNKNDFDFELAKEKMDYWMEENFAIISSELQYKNVVPKILIERFIETEDGSVLVDYKFFCSRGKVICCLLIIGRGSGEKWVFVDSEFEDLKLYNDFQNDEYKAFKPKSFSEMIHIAGKLSEDFPFVRVDLYDETGKVIFGELTFTPHGCIHEYLSLEAQKWLGSRIDLD